MFTRYSSVSGFLLLSSLWVNTACSLFDKVTRVEYEFETSYKHHKLVMDLPTGIVEESHDRDNKGYLVRTFRYKDGAEFFVACHDLNYNPLISLDQSSETQAKLPAIWGEPGSGTYFNGTVWSRNFREGFLIGYDFVKPGKRPAYDKAIHSAHIIPY